MKPAFVPSSPSPWSNRGAGRRGHPQSADYVLEYNNRKLAVVEAKRWDLGLTDGVQQAKDYASMLDVRFTYSSNGQGFYEIDMLTGEERELERDAFPTPQQLWERTFDAPDELRDSFATPWEQGGTWSPLLPRQCYQRALQAISDGKDRILLTLATGTGKTSILFRSVGNSSKPMEQAPKQSTTENFVSGRSKYSC